MILGIGLQMFYRGWILIGPGRVRPAKINWASVTHTGIARQRRPLVSGGAGGLWF
jgi:hypothetical protein